MNTATTLKPTNANLRQIFFNISNIGAVRRQDLSGAESNGQPLKVDHWDQQLDAEIAKGREMMRVLVETGKYKETSFKGCPCRERRDNWLAEFTK